MNRYRYSSSRARTMRQPLRKVVGYVREEVVAGLPPVLREKLECGHTQAPRHDMVGETTAARRRCDKCPPREGAC